MFFETAGIEVHPLIPPLVAFVISFFTVSGGVSGAFLLLPFQMSVLGFTSPAVSGTNQLYNIVAIPSGVYRYIKEGRMVWPLTWVVVLGTLPGVFVGALIRVIYLPEPGAFQVFAGFVLLYIGTKLFSDMVSKNRNLAQKTAEEKFHELVKNFKSKQNNSGANGKLVLPRVKMKSLSLKSLVYEFYGETFDIPTYKIFLISLVVGVVGGIYGIGGGAILAPIYVAFFALPVYTVAGAALMGTFITSIAGVVFFQLLAPFYPNMTVAPDYQLGILFGIGGFCGMYLGARLQKYLPAKLIKWILAICIIAMAVRYIVKLFELF